MDFYSQSFPFTVNRCGLTLTFTPWQWQSKAVKISETMQEQNKQEGRKLIKKVKHKNINRNSIANKSQNLEFIINFKYITNT